MGIEVCLFVLYGLKRWVFFNFSFIKFIIETFFCFCFTSHSRIFHSYGDVTSNFHLFSALMTIEQWGFFMLHLLWHRSSVYNAHLWEYVTHTSCRASGSGAVTTRFSDFGLSRPGIEPRCPACEANALPLCHDGCLKHYYPAAKLKWSDN